MPRNFCKLCGSPLTPDDDICPGCGRVLELPPEQTAPKGASIAAEVYGAFDPAGLAHHSRPEEPDGLSPTAEPAGISASENPADASEPPLLSESDTQAAPPESEPPAAPPVPEASAPPPVPHYARCAPPYAGQPGSVPPAYYPPGPPPYPPGPAGYAPPGGYGPAPNGYAPQGQPFGPNRNGYGPPQSYVPGPGGYPRYMPSSELPETVSFASALTMCLIGLVPLVGLVYLFVQAMQPSGRPNRRTFARGLLTARLIVLMAVLALAIFLLFSTMVNRLFYLP